MLEPLSASVRPIDHVLAGDADAPALLLRDRTIDYRSLEHAVGRVAAWLADRAEPGARVASWVGKGAVASVMPLAAPRAGLVHVPINPGLKRGQVQHILSDCGAVRLITNAGRAATLNPGDLPSTTHIADEQAVEAVLFGHGPALARSHADPQALASILYTSGSTGRPKGVMLSHANLWLGAEAVAEYLELAPSDRVLGVLPLSFDYGQNQLLSTWAAGGSVAPLDYLSARDVIRAVERFEITTLAGVPPLWVQLLDSDWPAETAARLTRLTNSGGALTRRLVHELRQRFANARLFAMYGITEAFRSTYLEPELIDARPESIGKAIPHAEVLVVRPDGSITDPDEPGELVHCGPLVAQGYWRDAERTAQRFRPAPPASRYGGMAVWSGDRVRRDVDGFLTFIGRDDEMIKASGTRISPTEIEEAAEATGLVFEAVACGVTDPASGQAIALTVRPRGPIEGDFEAQLRAALRATLPNFMQPRDIIVRADLPRNANGKLDRVTICGDMRTRIEVTP